MAVPSYLEMRVSLLFFDVFNCGHQDLFSPIHATRRIETDVVGSLHFAALLALPQALRSQRIMGPAFVPAGGADLVLLYCHPEFRYFCQTHMKVIRKPVVRHYKTGPAD